MQTQFTLNLREFILQDIFPALLEKGAVNFNNDDSDLLDTDYEIATCGMTPVAKAEEIAKECIEKGFLSTTAIDNHLHDGYAILEDATNYYTEQERDYYIHCVRNEVADVKYA